MDLPLLRPLDLPNLSSTSAGTQYNEAISRQATTQAEPVSIGDIRTIKEQWQIILVHGAEYLREEAPLGHVILAQLGSFCQNLHDGHSDSYVSDLLMERHRQLAAAIRDPLINFWD